MRLSRFVATPPLAAAVLAAAGPGRADDKAKPAAGPDRLPANGEDRRPLVHHHGPETHIHQPGQPGGRTQRPDPGQVTAPLAVRITGRAGQPAATSQVLQPDADHLVGDGHDRLGPNEHGASQPTPMVAA